MVPRQSRARRAAAGGAAVSAGVGRLAWWGWLTSPDESVAQRLRDFCDPFPPWLDSVTWLAAGLIGGIGTGWLAGQVLWPLRAGPAWQQNVFALVVALYVAAALGARDFPEETAGQFGRRVAALLLHLPYVALAAVAYLTVCGWAAAGLGLAVRADLTAVTPELGPIAVGLSLLLLGAVVTTSPRIFSGTRQGLTRTVPGAGSFALRLGGVAVYTALVAAHEIRFLHAHGYGLWGIFSPYPIDAGIREGLVLALALMLTIRWQEQLALAVGEGLFSGRPARSRRWPAACAPIPLALELALLRSEQPSDWRLAADYAELRGYPSGWLLRRAAALVGGRKTNPGALRGAALCLMLASHREGDQAQVAQEQLRRLLAAHRSSLAGPAWPWLCGLARGPQRLVMLGWVVRDGEELGLAPAAAWALLQTLRWTEPLGDAWPAERAELVSGILALIARSGRLQLIDELLRALDRWHEERPADASPAPLQMAEWAVVALGEAEPGADSTVAQALKLRGLAYQVALGDAARLVDWYAAARRYEGLAAGRRYELLSPSGYLSLWRLVTQRFADREEQARQEERYLVSRPMEAEIKRR